MITCESSTKLRSITTAISLGVKIEVCASASNKVHNVIHEKDSLTPKIKPSNRRPVLVTESYPRLPSARANKPNKGESHYTQPPDQSPRVL